MALCPFCTVVLKTAHSTGGEAVPVQCRVDSPFPRPVGSAVLNAPHDTAGRLDAWAQYLMESQRDLQSLIHRAWRLHSIPQIHD